MLKLFRGRDLVIRHHSSTSLSAKLIDKDHKSEEHIIFLRAHFIFREINSVGRCWERAGREPSNAEFSITATVSTENNTNNMKCGSENWRGNLKIIYGLCSRNMNEKKN